jgi:hypothetical protein
MYSINMQKFQNTPRNDKGISGVGDKRIRLPQSAFEDDSTPGYSRVLHPTKGWRSRNLDVIARHGQVLRQFDELMQVVRSGAAIG